MKIKVAFFADILSPDFDGASRTMYQIISRIPSEEFEYQFYTGDNKMGSHFEHEVVEVPSFRIPLQKRYRMGVPGLKSTKLQARLQSFNPDVIHISTPSMLGNWAIKYAIKHNISSISIFHTFFSSYIQYYFKNMNWLGNILRRLSDSMQATFYNKCDKIYVPSKSMDDELKRIGVATPNKVEVWARGINHELFHPNNENINALRRITGNEKPTILFVSRLVWEKNLKALIELYKAIEQHQHLYNLMVVGDGHAKSELESKMPKAIFMGNQPHDKLSSLYASADVLFFPSISETFGNVVLEGLASGLPALVADEGGTKDMIQNHHNGIICAEDNYSEHYAQLDLLLNDPERLQKMSSNARASSLEYDWEELTQRYFNEIRSLSKPAR